LIRPIARALIVSLLCASAGAQLPPNKSVCSLHVQITDEDGKALPKAFVYLHNERGTNQQVTPDRNAQFKMNLRLGLYDLFVSAPGFVPQAHVVDLRACKPVDLNLMLTIDTEHTDDSQN
jgi:hypothetical protein